MGLLGRGEELGRVAAALDEAAAGRGRVLGIVGEAGIGKTRLAQEAVTLAGDRGFVVMTGRTPVVEMAVAYAPVLEAVGDHLRGLDPVARAATTNGLPELRVLFGSLVSGRPEPLSDPALEQARLFEAVARLLERVQERAPVLLVVDDVHEADDASLTLLHYLSRRLEHRCLVTLLTYRTDADALRPLRDFHASLRRHGLLEEVRLARLDRPTLVELGEAWLDGPPDEALLDLLDGRAGGVPLFAETMLAALRDAGQLVRRGGCWTLAAGAVPDLPALARDVVLRPLNRLEPEERRLAGILAVAGETVPWDRLQTLAATDDGTLAARLNRLCAAGLVDEVVRAGQAGYRLHHPLIGEAVYDELGGVTRQEIHAALAAALERDATDDLQRLARHYRGAGATVDVARARSVLAAAGAQALELHANREAVASLRAALELGPAAGRGAAGGLHELLGDALARVGEQSAAISTWTAALPIAVAAGDVRRASRLHRRLAEAEWENGNLDEVRAHLSRGRELLARQPPSRELAELRLTEVWLLSWMHDFDAATAAAAALADLAAELDSPPVIAEALLAEARLLLARIEPAAALETARRALTAAQDSGDQHLCWRAHDLNVISLVWDGDHAVIRTHAAAALDLARELAVPALELRSTSLMAVTDFFAGDWDAVSRWTTAVLQQAPLVGQPRPAVHAVALAALLHSYRGDLGRVARVLDEVSKTYGRLAHDLSVQVLLVPAEIELALAHNRVNEAVELVDRTLPRVPGFAGWLLLSAGEAYVRAGRWAEALALVPRLASTAAAERSAMVGEARRIEGVVRAHLGEPERALVCLAEARSVFAHLDIPFFEARAAVEWGQRHGGEEGAAAVRDGLVVLERLGARPFVDRARAVLRDLGEAPPPRRQTGRGPLSAREREVACLAAEGLTAAQIAERLVISPHTARTHLKRIHERLAVSSRAELTRFVIDAGWLAEPSR